MKKFKAILLSISNFTLAISAVGAGLRKIENLGINIESRKSLLDEACYLASQTPMSIYEAVDYLQMRRNLSKPALNYPWDQSLVCPVNDLEAMRDFVIKDHDNSRSFRPQLLEKDKKVMLGYFNTPHYKKRHRNNFLENKGHFKHNTKQYDRSKIKNSSHK